MEENATSLMAEALQRLGTQEALNTLLYHDGLCRPDIVGAGVAWRSGGDPCGCPSSLLIHRIPVSSRSKFSTLNLLYRCTFTDPLVYIHYVKRPSIVKP